MSRVGTVTEQIRRLTVRRQPAGVWRSRALLGGVVATCIAVTAVAVTGAGSSSAGMKFAQSGHLVYNATLGKVFRIDGASKSADPVVDLSAAAGSRVVQTDQGGFVLSRGSVTEFGKSDLRVTDPRPVKPQEQPLGLESEAGPAFAIYPQAGMVVRFGGTEATVDANGSLGQPIVTPDGTLWVYVRPSGQLCQLPVDANRLACVAKLPSGHTGQLTLVGDQAVFVDTTAKELRAVDGGGFGRVVALPGVKLSADSLIAPNDVAGRVAILDQASNQLQLVDAAPVTTGRPAEPPLVRSLGAGKYGQLASSGNGLALIDAANGGRLVTLDQEGTPRKSRPIPRPTGKAKPVPGERPAIIRGADRRLYVDSEAGEHVLVVDGDGEVTQVPAEPDEGDSDERDKPKNNPKNQGKNPGRPQTVRPQQPRQTEQPVQGETNKPVPPSSTQRPRKPQAGDERDEPDESETTQRPKPPRKSERPQLPRESEKPRPPSTKPTVRAGKPGAPGNVSATAGNAAATVNWSVARANGATISSYRISWSGGSRTVTGDTRRLTVPGLTNGQSYTFTVRAVNSVGTGPGASSSRITLQRRDGKADAPTNLRATPGDGQIRLTWRRPNLNGGTFMSYSVVLDSEPETVSTTSYTWKNLDNGKRYTFQVMAVTRGPDGAMVMGEMATISATAGSGSGGPGSVTISQGAKADYQDDDCPQTDDCYFLNLKASGLEPDTQYRFRAYANGRQIHEDDDGYLIRTESDGTVDMRKFHNSMIGQSIRVTAELNGQLTQSNTIVMQRR